MAASNRTNQIVKLHKVAKKHYSPVRPDAGHDLLETLVYGICLENATFAAADALYQGLKADFFDFNEIRVSTVKELAEYSGKHPQPAGTAAHLKQFLQSTFETRYSWDLEDLKKQNIGKAVAVLQKIDGATTFAISYAVQNALGGHSIPVDVAMLNLLYTCGIINEAEASKGIVPGLERAIPKSKGSEFFSLTHQLGVDYLSSPHSAKVRGIIVEVDPEAKQRFPKRKSAAAEAGARGEKSAGEEAARKKKALRKSAKAKPAEAPAKTGKKKSAAVSESKSTAGASRKPAKRKPR